MCIAYLALGAHARWPLFIAANRDEFHARPCSVAQPWTQRPDIIAGLDLQGGGTWLGVTHAGRYALITNYREPGHALAHAPSRGRLVSDYLEGAQSPLDYARQVHADGTAYNGFNLIVGDRQQACYLSNRAGQAAPVVLPPGRYVLSNHLLDTPWPKARRLRSALDAFALEGLEASLAPAFDALRDATQAEEHALPNTGLTPERERLLSSPFIVSPDYGTRCSTLIALGASGQGLLSELSYDAQGRPVQRHDWPFRLVG
ncbi:hypothetical protein GSY71_02760 [Pusillimonas sp. TS35]|uniref:NRDE family protein n=1 Tax=Paracandidimonas lactea TaxID=2895524 RepID=UPI00137078B8|nr:NRDE family protein [Paracandidimonas lactea]MYN12071.1 hypothetical protein [Pusillimonas sp. TS35]